VSNPYTLQAMVEMKDWYGQGGYLLHVTSQDRSLALKSDASRADSRSFD